MIPAEENVKRLSNSSMASRVGRRRNSRDRSKTLVLSLLFAILSTASIVHGFTSTTTTTALSRTGKNANVGSHIHLRQNVQERQQQFSSRTGPLVLTSTKGADIDGATVNGASSSLFAKSSSQGISKLSAILSKIGMMTFLASMCMALPIALFPPYLLHRLKIISQPQQQSMSLANGQFCARWLLRLIPFCNLSCISSPEKETDPQPSVWVCNHTSALDVFMILAADHKMRGKKRRPIKIVYVSGKRESIWFGSKIFVEQNA